MANLLPLPKARFFDSNGDPLAGGKVFTYAAGTSTLQATYQDASMSVANANPVVLDANGEASIWVGANPYKIVLKDANDVTLWTVDNVTDIADGSITTNKLQDGVLSADSSGRAKMADGFLSADAEGRAKMADGFLSANSSGRAKVADGFLSADTEGRAKMADGFVTPQKKAALGHQVSGSSGLFSKTGDYDEAQVTNLSVTISTTGRPVFVGLLPTTPSATTSRVQVTSNNLANVSAGGYVSFYRGSTKIMDQDITVGGGGGSYSHFLVLPCSAFWMIDTPSEGSHTFSVKVRISGATTHTIGVMYTKLIAFEL